MGFTSNTLDRTTYTSTGTGTGTVPKYESYRYCKGEILEKKRKVVFLDQRYFRIQLLFDAGVNTMGKGDNKSSKEALKALTPD